MAKQIKAFKDVPVGTILQTECGQVYKKRSPRTLEMAEGHSHYNPEIVSWFYAEQNELFIVEG